MPTIMRAETETIRKYFAKLGLEPEIADIYLSLYSNGPQTISELSRTSEVERTRIYRLIDQLLASNLIEMEQSAGQKSARGVIKAAPVSNLRTLITAREQETKNLADELELIEKVLSRNSLSNPAAHVQFYSGQEGIRQMLGNELRSQTEIVSYGYAPLETAADKKLIQDFTRTIASEQISKRLLTNDKAPSKYVTQHRLISPDVYPITHVRTIYDDITAYYLLKAGEGYGFEIRNKEIADAERRLFELLWEKTQKAEV